MVSFSSCENVHFRRTSLMIVFQVGKVMKNVFLDKVLGPKVLKKWTFFKS